MTISNDADCIHSALQRAVATFNNGDDRVTLLCPRTQNPQTAAERAAAGERAIAHRLAVYLETELRALGIVGGQDSITVDCEYNRHLQGTKTLAEKASDPIKEIVRAARRRELEADDDGFYVFSVAPDIVVHQRRTDQHNLLVVEVKKRSNQEAEDYDALKLQLFTMPATGGRGYGYVYGVWVVAEDTLEAPDRELRIVARFRGGEREVGVT